MANSVRFEDRLEGSSNFVSWKFRVMITLREQELEAFVEKETTIPDEEDEKRQCIKNKNKTMKLLVDIVKDHIVPIISKLDTTFKIFSTLESMYELNNTSRALSLK